MLIAEGFLGVCLLQELDRVCGFFFRNDNIVLDRFKSLQLVLNGSLPFCRIELGLAHLLKGMLRYL